MSGFGTKKPGGDRAVQLTFPSVFQDEYHQLRFPLKYYPTNENTHATLWAGDNDPAKIHEAWAKEAHDRVRNGVYATKIAKQRAFQSHNGYYGMPKPVRSQRKLGFQTGALQSGNVGSTLYPNDNVFGSGMVGGVLRTKQGQEYAQKLLRMRAEQLSKLEGIVLPPREMSELSSMGAETERDKLTEGSRIELQGLMEALLAKFGSGTEFDAKTSEMMLRFMSLLLRFAVEATQNELNIIKDDVGDMVKALDVYDSSSAGNDAVLDDTQYKNAKGSGSFLYTLAKRLYAYVEGMLVNVNKSTAERKITSQSLIKSLNLSQFQRIGLTAKQKENVEIKRLRYSQRRDAEAQDRAEADAEQRRPRGMAGREAQERKEQGEDDGDGREQFSADHRSNFGRNASAMVGFHGEEPHAANEADLESRYASTNVSEPMFRTLEQISGSTGRNAMDLERRLITEQIARRYGDTLDVDTLRRLPATTRERELKNLVRSGVIPRDEGGAVFLYEMMDNESAVGRILDLGLPEIRRMLRG